MARGQSPVEARGAGVAPRGGPVAVAARQVRPLARRWDVYEEHLAEAGFLWSQWVQDSRAPNYTMAEVQAGPEERLIAHLDGLVLGGAAVREKLLQPALAEEDPELVFAAAWAFLAADDGDFGPMIV